MPAWQSLRGNHLASLIFQFCPHIYLLRVDPGKKQLSDESPAINPQRQRHGPVKPHQPVRQELDQHDKPSLRSAVFLALSLFATVLPVLLQTQSHLQALNAVDLRFYIQPRIR